jgi:hypothetical protein
LSLFPDLEVRQKAAKNDDAETLVDYWDGPFWEVLSRKGRSPDFLQSARSTTVGNLQKPILQVLRDWMLWIWRVAVRKSLQRHLSSLPMEDRKADVKEGVDCLRRVGDASFWDWSAGSRLFFWRWPAPLREWARDGLPVYTLCSSTRRTQRYATQDPHARGQFRGCTSRTRAGQEESLGRLRGGQ